jgi:hypothetical protein
MINRGRPKYIWTKELDNMLLSSIEHYKIQVELVKIFNTSWPTIDRRLKHMGFDGLKDARKVLTDY